VLVEQCVGVAIGHELVRDGTARMARVSDIDAAALRRFGLLRTLWHATVVGATGRTPCPSGMMSGPYRTRVQNTRHRWR
jgi:hypothetical protein